MPAGQRSRKHCGGPATEQAAASHSPTPPGDSPRPEHALIVVDASIVASALGDDGFDGERARGELVGERLFAPELIDLEVASVWRRAARAGRLDERRAGQALTDLAARPLARAPHQPLMGRIWELHDNLTPYDAAYVARRSAGDPPCNGRPAPHPSARYPLRDQAAPLS
jgi:predicted nucleic acid-binding protein